MRKPSSESTSSSTFDKAVANPDRYEFRVDIPELDYYVIYGSTFREILSRHTELTGRSRLIPKWRPAPQVGRVSPNEAYFKAMGLMSGAGGPNPRDGRGPETLYFQK